MARQPSQGDPLILTHLCFYLKEPQSQESWVLVLPLPLIRGMTCSGFFCKARGLIWMISQVSLSANMP